MIFVEQEPKDMGVWGQERCCFCRTPTKCWALLPDGAKVTGDSVACCEACARRAFREDLPTKEQWMRNERIADRAYSASPVPPPKPTRKRTTR
jgi:hypothetical protein